MNNRNNKANAASNLNPSKHSRPEFSMECEIGAGTLDVKKELAAYGFQIDEAQAYKFNIHSLRLRQYSQIMNLTKIVDHDDIIARHFLDSLIPLNHIRQQINPDTKVIDIGTGAGFPGFPIAIYTNCKLTAMDSLAKRINFLQDVIDTANINNIELVHARAEQISKQSPLRYAFDFCFFRAVSDLSEIIKLAHNYIKPTGKIIALKSADIDEEIKSAANMLKKYKLKIEYDHNYIDALDINRRVLVISRI